MIELFLFFCFVLLLGYHTWYARETGKERETWMKALMSKDLNDFTQSKLAENPPEPFEQPLPDVVESENAAPDLFQKMIDNAGNEDTEKADAQSA